MNLVTDSDLREAQERADMAARRVREAEASLHSAVSDDDWRKARNVFLEASSEKRKADQVLKNLQHFKAKQ